MNEKKLKKSLLAQGMTIEQADALLGLGKKAEEMKFRRREFGSFYAMTDKDYNVIIGALNGWKVVYPPYTSAWKWLVIWLDRWDELSECMVAFVKVMVYPVCNRVEGIDSEYVKDLLAVQERLDERVRNSMPEPTEEERKADLEAVAEMEGDAGQNPET